MVAEHTKRGYGLQGGQPSQEGKKGGPSIKSTHKGLNPREALGRVRGVPCMPGLMSCGLKGTLLAWCSCLKTVNVLNIC